MLEDNNEPAGSCYTPELSHSRHALRGMNMMENRHREHEIEFTVCKRKVQTIIRCVGNTRISVSSSVDHRCRNVNTMELMRMWKEIAIREAHTATKV